MPELAEVDYFRKRWNPGLGETVVDVEVHPQARIFRETDPAALKRHLIGRRLLRSAAAAKQMLFESEADGWLGIHLGMTGELSLQPADYVPRRADHLVLRQSRHTLVFSDPRMFGQVRFTRGGTAPEWWTRIPPALTSDAFGLAELTAFLQQRRRAPIKAVLLMQERFPGIGNWMADEILWRAAIHPRQPAGSLSAAEQRTLYREVRWVCRRALETIGETFDDPPRSWLFPHRWRDGGMCPRTRTPLSRDTIGGRTTCWSPARQRLRR
jgi:formamidopyrimidine-DNA glycosylase